MILVLEHGPEGQALSGRKIETEFEYIFVFAKRSLTTVPKQASVQQNPEWTQPQNKSHALQSTDVVLDVSFELIFVFHRVNVQVWSFRQMILHSSGGMFHPMLFLL